ncbi:hypothetical protein RI129_000900 [Pyrocoelia pectoralis]|uniref:Uncharacterized protein n=1 Tax=Pyrocoelia pectoralis TaxID=417401 RepID=A0AAN7VSF2_9COLE
MLGTYYGWHIYISSYTTAPRDDCRNAFIHLKVLTLPCLYMLLCVCHIRLNVNNFLQQSNIHRYDTRNKLQYRLPFCRLNKTQNSSVIMGFMKGTSKLNLTKPNLCEATTSNQYIDATKEFRETNCYRHYKFLPHSTRHASTSAVFRQSVPLYTLCKTAGWSQRFSTFAKFYNHPLSNETDFGKDIFNLATV